MECTACGTDDELVYACERCREVFCATHHAHRYHDCEPARSRGPRGPIARERSAPEAAAPDRPRAQLYPQEVDGPARSRRDRPPEADRPGYGPERFTADPVEPATTVPEWFRRQTYLSLAVKVGLVATLCNLLAFSLIGAALVFSAG